MHCGTSDPFNLAFCGCDQLLKLYVANVCICLSSYYTVYFRCMPPKLSLCLYACVMFSSRLDVVPTTLPIETWIQ